MLLNSVSNAGGKSWRKQKRTHFTDVGRALLFRGKYVNLSTTDKHGWLTCAYCLGTEIKITFKHQISGKRVYLCLCSEWALKQRHVDLPVESSEVQLQCVFLRLCGSLGS